MKCCFCLMIYDERVLSSIVTIAFIILGTVIGVALLWAFVMKSTSRSGEIVDPDCLTVNLELMNCEAYNACSYYSGLQYYEADVLVKRNIGKGNVTGLRFIFENIIKKRGAYDKDLGSRSFNELDKIDFVEPFGSIPIQVGFPDSLRIVALIGKNKDVCPLTSNAMKCPIMNVPLQFGVYANDTDSSKASSKRGGNCCQYPANNNECYDGKDTRYQINPTNGRLTNGLPPGNKTTCCLVDPYNGGSAGVA